MVYYASADSDADVFCSNQWVVMVVCNLQVNIIGQRSTVVKRAHTNHNFTVQQYRR